MNGLPVVASVSFLANGEKADVVQNGSSLNIKLPAEPLNEYDTVVKVIFTNSMGE